MTSIWNIEGWLFVCFSATNDNDIYLQFCVYSATFRYLICYDICLKFVCISILCSVGKQADRTTRVSRMCYLSISSVFYLIGFHSNIIYRDWIKIDVPATCIHVQDLIRHTAWATYEYESYVETLQVFYKLVLFNKEWH